MMQPDSVLLRTTSIATAILKDLLIVSSCGGRSPAVTNLPHRKWKDANDAGPAEQTLKANAVSSLSCNYRK
jgi:hypothetical protein